MAVSRIVACDESSVTFRYTPSKSKKVPSKKFRTRRVEGHEFVRGFVQHTLPAGFQKIRYYGWLSPNCRVRLDEVKWLVWLFLGWTFWLASGHAPQPSPPAKPTLRCAACGSPLRVVAITFDPIAALHEHALAYLDSG